MLQRIQSVYLFIVFVFAVLFAVLPMAYFPAEMADMPLRLANYYLFFSAIPDLTGEWMGIALLVFFIMALVLTVYTTFQYKRRVHQIKMGKLNIFVHAAMILIAFFFLDNIRNQVHDAGFSYGAGIFFPIVSLILILLANKAIRRDEELVRSADRIR